MPRRAMLNIRDHLDHVQLVIEGYRKYGKCPAIDDEVNSLSLYNKAIMRKHDEAKAKGSRKDIR